jgi:TM2 domain-containing membrane protein YozV
MTELQGKSALIAIILSFLIPGLGDLYCGSWVKAIVFFVLVFFAFALLFVAGIGAFLFAIIWVAGLISAWMSANKSQERRIAAAGKLINHGT